MIAVVVSDTWKQECFGWMCVTTSHEASCFNLCKISSNFEYRIVFSWFLHSFLQSQNPKGTNSHHNSRVLIPILIVLKTVENLGVSYVKTSEEYRTKLYTEFSNLGFPHKVGAVRKCTFQLEMTDINFWNWPVIGNVLNWYSGLYSCIVCSKMSFHFNNSSSCIRFLALDSCVGFKPEFSD